MKLLKIIIVTVILGLVSCQSASSMKNQFESASSVKEEMEASQKLNREFSGYTVIFIDSTGLEITPQKDGEYQLVHSIRVEFADSSLSATRVILDRDNLALIMGE